MFKLKQFVVAFAFLATGWAGYIKWEEWEHRTGCFSYHNYERINVGMDIRDIEAILGASGEIIDPSSVPGVAPHQKISGSPEGYLGVVWGERIYQWKEGDSKIILIGTTKDRAISKYFIYYSL